MTILEVVDVFVEAMQSECDVQPNQIVLMVDRKTWNRIMAEMKLIRPNFEEMVAKLPMEVKQIRIQMGEGTFIIHNMEEGPASADAQDRLRGLVS